MSRTTEDWKERIRYEVDTGTFPRVRPSRLRRLTRFLVITVGITSALVAYSHYSGPGPAETPDGAVAQPPQQTSPVTNPEPGKRRSFTSKGEVPPNHANAAPQVIRTEAAPAKVARAEPAPPPATTAAPPERVKRSDAAAATRVPETSPKRESAPPPVTTVALPGSVKLSDATPTSGDPETPRKRTEPAPPPITTAALPERVKRPEPTAAVADAPRKRNDVERPSPTNRPAPRQARPSDVAERSVEIAQSRKLRRQARRSIAAEPIVQHASLPASPAPRRYRAPAEPVVRASAERVVAMAPRKTVTVCVYFVVCF
jgi:hypothetical protein